MLLLEQDTIIKKQVNKTLLERKIKFAAENNKQYKFKVIIDSIVYSKEANN